MTGNVKRFIKKTELEAIQITKEMTTVEEPFVLVTYTIGIGQVPPIVAEFLNHNENYKYLKGVAVSGNKLWGSNFGRAGDIISREYQVPLLVKFELGGLTTDIQKFKEEYDKLWSTLD